MVSVLPKYYSGYTTKLLFIKKKKTTYYRTSTMYLYSYSYPPKSKIKVMKKFIF